MANALRGEIEAELDGERRTLCLTLGALAELETALGADSLAGLAARFEEGRFTARDLARIIAAGLRGAGHSVSDDEVAGMTAQGGLAGFVDIVSRLVEATFAPLAGGEAGSDAQKNG